MKYLIVLTLLLSGVTHAVTCSNMPDAAVSLGFHTLVFYDEPNLEEVSTTDQDSTSKWYPGIFSSPVNANMVSRSLLGQSGSLLSIGLGGGVSSETHTSGLGVLPFLSGAKGFYVEIAMHLSSNDPDHFSGLFLQTVEHNLAKQDHFPSDPPGFERWSEIDISESGYGPGNLETFMNWAGSYPNYQRKYWNSYGHDAKLDWTVEHRFGVSYEPTTNTLQWFLDDVPTYSLQPTQSVIQSFHYFVVMEASSHGGHVPYEMFVRYVRAYEK
jgi:hypothetical protein